MRKSVLGFLSSIIFYIILERLVTCENHTIHKRQLLFPSSCVLQFAVGVAVPSKLSYKNLATNGGILLNLDLPDNLTHFASPYISRTGSESHHSLLETMHNLNGLDGRSCVQKSICQLQETPLKGDDIIHKLIGILFEPNITYVTPTENCDEIYPKCPVSLVDFLTEIYIE